MREPNTTVRPPVAPANDLLELFLSVRDAGLPASFDLEGLMDRLEQPRTRDGRP